MTQEQKELLLKDLCARLPYGVKAYVKNWSKLDRKWYEGVYTVESIHPHLNNILACSEKSSVEVIIGYDDYEIKPYLLPLSSMTEEQQEELMTITNGKFRSMWGVITNAIPRKNTSEWGVSENAFIDGIEVINILYTWLLKNHFDINGLIPMGLANDATNLNIY
jgi:hypothetical protein